MVLLAKQNGGALNKNTKCCCKTIRSIAHLNIQYAHRFYGFKGEAQYLHGHTGGLTLEVDDTVNPGDNAATAEFPSRMTTDRCPWCGITLKEFVRSAVGGGLLSVKMI